MLILHLRSKFRCSNDFDAAIFNPATSSVFSFMFNHVRLEKFIVKSLFGTDVLKSSSPFPFVYFHVEKRKW